MGVSRESKIIRPLGSFERLMSARNVLGTYLGTSLCCRYGIPEHLLSEDAQPDLQVILERAVASTVLEHPQMQVGLVNATADKPAFAQLKSIDLDKHITWVIGSHDEGAYDELIASTTIQTIDKAFHENETRPGWEIIVLRRGPASPSMDVLLNWNHPHFDGTGSKIFHLTLLRVLNTHSRNSSPEDAADIPSLRGHILTPNAGTDENPMTPPSEQLAPSALTLGYVAKTLATELKPAWLTSPSPSNSTWAPTRLPPGVAYTTVMRGFLLDPQTLSTILSVCRTHKTTLTALINGVIFASLIPALEQRGIPSPSIAAETPINLRRFAETGNKASKSNPTGLDPDKTMMCFVSVIPHHFDKKLTSTVKKIAADAKSETERMAALEKSVWDAAAVVKGDIDNRIQTGMKNEASALVKYVSDVQRYYKLLQEKPRQYAWLVTNIGVMDGGVVSTRDNTESAVPNGTGDTPSPWTIQRGLFTLSADLTGPFFQISTVTIKGGELSINLTWPRGVADDTIGEGLIKDIEKWLRFLAKN